MTEMTGLYRNKKMGKGDKVPGLELFRVGVVEWGDMNGLTGTKWTWRPASTLVCW